MAKKVTGMIKLQVQAAKANPAPPIGPALGQHGVNIPGFCKKKSALLGIKGNAQFFLHFPDGTGEGIFTCHHGTANAFPFQGEGGAVCGPLGHEVLALGVFDPHMDTGMVVPVRDGLAPAKGLSGGVAIFGIKIPDFHLTCPHRNARKYGR